jgi:hypothetical protein
VKQSISQVYLTAAPIRCGQGHASNAIANPIVNVARQDVRQGRIVNRRRLDEPPLPASPVDPNAKFFGNQGLMKAGRQVLGHQGQDNLV